MCEMLNYVFRFQINQFVKFGENSDWTYPNGLILLELFDGFIRMDLSEWTYANELIELDLCD